MCWKGKLELKTAQKDFKVYKVMIMGVSGLLLSAYKNFIYKRGHTYHSKILGVPLHYYNNDISKVDVALHSYSLELTKCKQKDGTIIIISKQGVIGNCCLDFFRNHYNDYIVVPCLIPKEAKYCINEFGEIISDTLQVL